MLVRKGIAMKKIMNLTLLLLLFLLFSACVPSLPQGVWVSDEPHIILYFAPAYRFSSGARNYPGLHIAANGEITKLYVRVSQTPYFTIYDFNAIHNNGTREEARLVRGAWIARSGQLHYLIESDFLGKTVDDTIIFNRVRNYESINPADWLSP